MNVPNGEPRLELRDPEGNTLGFFVSERQLREEADERESLRKELAALQGELTRLREERDALRRERDVYLRSLHAVKRECVKPVTVEELADLKANGVPEEQFLQEIDTLFPAKGVGGLR